MTFYRKYRPQTFADVTGQPQVTEILQRALAAGQPAHAYLFAGPRGTGKTSVARILAKALNCLDRQNGAAEPCNHCANCMAIDKGAFLDVVEIDAASHNSVESIRELTSQVATSPAIGKFKVYILDEAHMLSNSAFNALLKTLEEPPAHVCFVLCTTEAHKVPVTVASRCQRLTFVRATVPQLSEQLSKVAKAEEIKIEPDALELLAQLAEGGYRDAEMLLEQVSSADRAKPVTLEDLQQRLGLASRQTIDQLLNDLAQQDAPQVLIHLEDFASSGGHIRQLIDSLLEQCRWLLLASVDTKLVGEAGADAQNKFSELAKQLSQPQLLHIIQALLDARQRLQLFSGSQQALALESSLLEALQPSTTAMDDNKPTNQQTNKLSQTRNTKTQGDVAITAIRQPAEKQSSAQASSVKRQESSNNGQDLQPTQQPQNTQNTTTPDTRDPSPEPIEDDQVLNPTQDVETGAEPIPASIPQPPPSEITTLWPQVLDQIRGQSRSVEALLRDCLPVSFDGKILVLQFWYAFHKNKLEIDKNRKMVESAVSQLIGQPVKIECTLGDKKQRPKRRPMSQEDIHNVADVEEADLLDAAVDIFGGEVVDE